MKKVNLLKNLQKVNDNPFIIFIQVFFVSKARQKKVLQALRL